MYPNEETILTQLNRTLAWVWENSESDLYQTLWQKHGITKCPHLESLNDITQLPVATKQDFLAYPNPLDRLYIPQHEASFLASTTGSTTGEPFFIWRNVAGNSYYRKIVAEGAQRALLLWTSHGARPINVAQFTQTGLQIINVDPHQMGMAEQLSAKAQINTLITSPSLALQFAKHVQDQSIINNIGWIVFWGESTTPAIEKALKKAFPKAALCNAYASAETYGITLYTTKACQSPTSLCHVNTEETYVEIVDGEMLLTTLKLPHATPLVRFKMGDQGRWHDESCPCGDTNPRIVILGREGVDFVRCHGFEFQMNKLEERLTGFTDDIAPWLEATITSTLSDDKPQLHITLTLNQLSTSPTPIEELQRSIIDSILLMPISANYTVLKAIEHKLVTEPTVIFTDMPKGENKNKRFKLIQA